MSWQNILRYRAARPRKTDRRVDPLCKAGGVVITHACGHYGHCPGKFSDPEAGTLMLKACAQLCSDCAVQHSTHSFPR